MSSVFVIFLIENVLFSNQNFNTLNLLLCLCYTRMSELKTNSGNVLCGVIVSKGFHSTCVKRMGGGHAHAHDEPFYLHAKHMYNLDRMKHQKLTMTLGVFTAFSIGVGVPIYAVIFQQRKTGST
ncbi:unnamed protein product [Ilex paraguariensis]|uniref:SLL1 protein n=1 Tax=Ilex paraguariensis TaxID=185542 RepID=A0ABC8QX00_9AQUA